MSKIARVVVLVTALTSLFAVMTPAAGAVTWTNTGSTTVHATGVGGTLSVGANSLACTGSTASATAPAHSAAAVYSVVGTVTFSPCTLIAGQAAFAHCGFTLTGATWDTGTPARTTGVADVTCDLRLVASPSAKLCHIEGTAPSQYIDPSGANPGRLTLTTNGTGLTVTHASGTSCLLGTGTGHLSEQTLVVTTVPGSPIITRHP
ncbi:hypothetical protein [Baekduia sp. Peel2402]|uniref:hypothetical protein n=1 Tax=Baekduia sp. Peel2402 TaxID=3458296 RepID=UPI00403EE5A5